MYLLQLGSTPTIRLFEELRYTRSVAEFRTVASVLAANFLATYLKADLCLPKTKYSVYTQNKHTPASWLLIPPSRPSRR